MPSTHTNLHYHLVFSTKDRQPLLASDWRDRFHAYVGGVARGKGGVPLAVGGAADHVHALVGLRATHCLADFVRDLKRGASDWVRETMGVRGFLWQEGYAAFTVGASQLEGVRRYIASQEEHHRKGDFQAEYVALLREHGVEYDERYLW